MALVRISLAIKKARGRVKTPARAVSKNRKIRERVDPQGRGWRLRVMDSACFFLFDGRSHNG